MARQSRRGRGGGAEARRAARNIEAITAYPPIKRIFKPFEVLDENGLKAIEDNADRLLDVIGVEFREDPEALDMWRRAGARVEGERVRMEPGMCRSLLSSAPREFTQSARNPERSVTIGGDHTVFVPVYGPPFIRNLEEGRRYANIEDFRNFVKLAYSSSSLHHSGGTVCEPVDVPVSKRHLDMVYSHIRFSDKPFMGSVTHPERAKDTLAMARIVFGDAMDDRCVVVSLINANSPLVFDETMLGALKVYAKAGQATIVSPFVLAGAMSPVTIAGTLSQILAEVMAGAAFTQLCRPGAPVVFGTFASSISMQSGAPTFGTPESSLTLIAAAQLARRLGLPFRSGGSLCGAKIPDAQAAHESAATMMAAMLAGVNFCIHAAGWLEGGLAAGYEKFVIDADQLEMMQRFSQGIGIDEKQKAFEAFVEVGPGNHFLGCAHTREFFESAFYRSPLADNNSYEQWREEGERDIASRAADRVKSLLETYRPPPLDEAVDAELLDFMERKKATLPDSVS